ncbi:MAG: PepSY domain-containing protein [Pseudomonadota bacterium]|nr:PepSY domain-containing protein [Pseudomonadota bacterium]
MKRSSLIRFLWHWHRRFGLVACLVLLLLAITGILLNHSPQFGWDRKPISPQWLLKSYGFAPPEAIEGLLRDDHYWVPYGRRLFFDHEHVVSCTYNWNSLVSMDDLVIAGCADQVALLADDGSLLESISTLPEPQLQSIGRVEGESRVLLQFSRNQYLLDLESLQWEAVSGLVADASAMEPLPQALVSELNASFRVEDLTWERFLLDLHAGRWFGGWGWLIMDLGALFLITLSVSGVLMYTLRRTR